MQLSDITEEARAALARDLAIGRANEEIARAEAALDAAPATFTGTERMLAHRDLHFWMAKKIIAESGVYL